MLGYLSADIRKTVSFEEQIIFIDNPSIFSHQMEAVVFIILQIYFSTRAFFKKVETNRAVVKYLMDYNRG